MFVKLGRKRNLPNLEQLAGCAGTRPKQRHGKATEKTLPFVVGVRRILIIILGDF
jgi:hypothetical protein